MPERYRLTVGKRVHFHHQPVVNHLYDVTLLLAAQFPPARDRMPFFRASAAAGRRSVLGDKYRVPAHRRLLAVISNLRRGQPFGDKICRVAVDNLRPFIITILPLFHPEVETRAER